MLDLATKLVHVAREHLALILDERIGRLVVLDGEHLVFDEPGRIRVRLQLLLLELVHLPLAELLGDLVLVKFEVFDLVDEYVEQPHGSLELFFHGLIKNKLVLPFLLNFKGLLSHLFASALLGRRVLLLRCLLVLLLFSDSAFFD